MKSRSTEAPVFIVVLDRGEYPCQFTAAAVERFRKLRGFEATQIGEHLEKAPQDTLPILADWFWCGFGDDVRAWLTPRELERQLTLARVMKLAAQIFNQGPVSTVN